MLAVVAHITRFTILSPPRAGDNTDSSALSVLEAIPDPEHWTEKVAACYDILSRTGTCAASLRTPARAPNELSLNDLGSLKTLPTGEEAADICEEVENS